MSDAVVFRGFDSNTIAGIFTIVEFFVAAITAIFVGSLIHGYTLTILHIRGFVPIDHRSLSTRSIVKGTISFFLALLLAASVALVESGLKTSFRISPHSRDTSACISVDDNVSPHLLLTTVVQPIFRFEGWALLIARQIQCRERGIGSISTSLAYDEDGRSLNVSAPTCRTSKSNSLLPKIDIGLVKFHQTHIELTPGTTPAFEILPFSHNLRRSPSGTLNVNAEECRSRNISSHFFLLESEWKTETLDGRDFARYLHNSMCEQLEDNNVTFVPSQTVRNVCSFLVDVDDEIGIDCISRVAEERNISTYYTDFANMATLFVGKTSRDASYACTNASVRVHFTFVEGKFTSALGDSEGNVMMITKVETLSGHCERTVHVLGRSTLLNSAFAEWKGNEYASADRVTRLHTFSILEAPLLFADVLQTGMGTSINRSSTDGCTVRALETVTMMERDWRYIFFAAAVVVCGTFIAFGLVARLVFWRWGWQVASTMWSFRQVVWENDKDNEVGGALAVRTSPWEWMGMRLRNGKTETEANEMEEGRTRRYRIVEMARGGD